MRKEFYGFDLYMDFIHDVQDFENEEFLQVFPNPIIVNDNIPTSMFSAYGLKAKNYQTFSITISEGKAKIILQDDTNNEIPAIDYILYFQSDKGSVTLTDTHDTYTLSWEKVADNTYMLTNANGTQIIWDGKQATPVDINAYQQDLINIFHSLPKDHDLEDIDTSFFDSLKQHLFNKIQKAENQKNQMFTLCLILSNIIVWTLTLHSNPLYKVFLLFSFAIPLATILFFHIITSIYYFFYSKYELQQQYLRLVIINNIYQQELNIIETKHKDICHIISLLNTPYNLRQDNSIKDLSDKSLYNILIKKGNYYVT